MSGDVQPRKRKDKKKKKDELGIEEPRGTAAALGEGDIFMHSQNDHGTGGHWCAKIIFFSLLAVLIALIGLIILENRGLTELEANSVESRYSGVLEGWLEDVEDHHDEHTLDLKHHDDEDDDDHGELEHDDEHDDDSDHDDDDEHDHEDDEEEPDDDEDEHDDENNTEEDDNESADHKDDEDSQEANDDDQNEASDEQDLETGEEDEDEVEEPSYSKFYQNDENQVDNDEDNDNDDDDDDDLQKEDERESAQDDAPDDDSQENDDGDEDSIENAQENEEEDDHEEPEDASDVELEHIEEEVFDDDVSSEPAPVSRQNHDSREAPNVSGDDDDVELLEPNDDDDDDDLPELLPIPSSKAKPLVEVEESPSTERPHDTLAVEEEYERQQEELRKEKEEASKGMWVKLVVGGALLVATQAVLRRATQPRESDNEADTTREETPLSERRMTLIPEHVPPPTVAPKVVQEPPRPAAKESTVITPPPPEPEEVVEEEEEEIVVSKDQPTVDKELYSDEEEIEEEEAEEPSPSIPAKEIPKSVASDIDTPKEVDVLEKEPSPEPEEEEYEDDDVEIIEDEELGEEVEEEEISDVDDTELLSRLEAKYGRLPEPERPGMNKKDGGNSIEDEWPGEPADSFWRDELDNAEQDLRQGEWSRAAKRAGAPELKASGRARYIVAKALDSLAEAKRDNAILTKAIAAYLELLKMNERLTDKKLVEVTQRALDRIMFRGNYLGAEPIYRLLIRRFPDVAGYRNNLTIAFLMANRVDLAEEVLKETLKVWPDDRVALAHHGFILKTLHNKLEEAVEAFTKALEGDEGPANEARFYYHLGDSLILLGRMAEAHEVHKRGAKLGHFLSPSQRSLYNVNRLKSKPWWNVEQTPYARLAKALEGSWRDILKEGLAAQELYEKEKEGLMEKGEWSQLDIFVRGREVPGRCARAPVTCKVINSEPLARCRRGQVKFSAMGAGSHVRPHVGPTNCRLRMHLGLRNTDHTYIRVDKEIRQWQRGKVLMFDDSFEHEVWHNGTDTRLVLIVDVWHPDLTAQEKRDLPAI